MNKCDFLIWICVASFSTLGLIPTSVITHTVPRHGVRYLEQQPTPYNKPRILNLPVLNTPRQIVERWLNRMGRSMRSLPVLTTKMVGDQMSTMARTGRRINNGIVIVGRSMSSMLREMFS